ncbi:MAG TPA: phosphodiester glycosidase family protein [Armatimonadota bacterium]|nr:phosphodiester glycosidase family protein [Armatimonadota bacterium]HOS42985.1 phosphodiester glycosidase family protein [Armatimonadota bacterium]
MVRVTILIVCLLGGLLGIAAGEAGPPPPGVRFSTAADAVRVVLDLPGAAAFTDRSTPRAAVVDVTLPLARAVPVIAVNDPVVSGIAVTPDAAGMTVLTVSLLKPRKVNVFAVPAAEGKPFRVVVDVLKRFALEESRDLSPAIRYTRLERQTDDRYLLAHLLEVNAADPRVRIGAAAAAGDRERVSDMVARTGAAAGVNGGYFLDGTRPVGLLKVDGQVLSLPLWGRTAAAFPPAGAPTFGNPAGRWRVTLPDGAVRDLPDYLDVSIAATPPEEAVISGMNFGATPHNPQGLTVVVRDGKIAARGTESAPLHRRDVAVLLRGERATALDALLACDAPIAVTPVLDGAWAGVATAVGAGPRLLRNGALENTAAAERFRADVALGRPARTGLGVTAASRVILAVIEAPGPYGGGATLEELAALLKARGATDAMNLDGGGSSCLVLGAETVTAPPGAWVRPVASGILVYDDRVPPVKPAIAPAAVEEPAPAE